MNLFTWFLALFMSTLPHKLNGYMTNDFYPLVNGLMTNNFMSLSNG
jgi:hypothetical protein